MCFSSILREAATGEATAEAAVARAKEEASEANAELLRALEEAKKDVRGKKRADMGPAIKFVEVAGEKLGKVIA